MIRLVLRLLVRNTPPFTIVSTGLVPLNVLLSLLMTNAKSLVTVLFALLEIGVLKKLTLSPSVVLVINSVLVVVTASSLTINAFPGNLVSRFLVLPLFRQIERMRPLVGNTSTMIRVPSVVLPGSVVISVFVRRKCRAVLLDKLQIESTQFVPNKPTGYQKLTISTCKQRKMRCSVTATKVVPRASRRKKTLIP